MKSSSATPICKVCLKPFESDSIGTLVFGAKTVCFSCFRSFLPRFWKWKEGRIPCLSIYEYGQGFRSLLFQFKGCFDYELKDVFLERVLPILKLRYRGYVIVPVPSYAGHDEARGFNHVIEMFSSLGLPFLCPLEKTADVKQASLGKKARKDVKKYLRYKEGISIQGKKILLVDDVFTTDNTARACIKLLQEHHPKKIALLVMSTGKRKEQ